MRTGNLAHRTSCLGTLAALLLTVSVAAAEPPDPTEVANLIRQLGSDESTTREEAARRLEAFGDAILGPLRRAAAGPNDPDLRLRAIVLARKIESVAYGEVHRLIKEGRQLHAAALSRDGRLALVGGLDSPVILFDTGTGKEVRRFEGHTGGVWAVAFSSDGRRAVTGGGATLKDGTWIWDADSSVRVWDVATGKELRRIEGHVKAIRVVAFSPDDRLILSGGQDGTLRLSDAGTGKTLRVMEGHQGSVGAAVFLADGREMISTGWDGTVRLWDPSTGKELRRFEGHAGWVMAAAASPDGKRIATAGADRTVRLWDVATGKEVRRFRGHTTMVLTAAFAADGKRLVTGAGTRMEGETRYVPARSDYGMRVWDVETGQPLHVFEDHGGPVLSLACDGRHVLSAGGDGTLRLWKMSTR